MSVPVDLRGLVQRGDVPPSLERLFQVAGVFDGLSQAAAHCWPGAWLSEDALERDPVLVSILHSARSAARLFLDSTARLGSVSVEVDRVFDCDSSAVADEKVAFHGGFVSVGDGVDSHPAAPLPEFDRDFGLDGVDLAGRSCEYVSCGDSQEGFSFGSGFHEVSPLVRAGEPGARSAVSAPEGGASGVVPMVGDAGDTRGGFSPPASVLLGAGGAGSVSAPPADSVPSVQGGVA